jgi:hypothetical protein
MSTNKPVHEVKLGRIRATIWSNPGEKGPMYSVQLTRLYKDEKADQWADSASFGRDDLLAVAKAADLAHSWIFDQLARDKTAAADE